MRWRRLRVIRPDARIVRARVRVAALVCGLRWRLLSSAEGEKRSALRASHSSQSGDVETLIMAVAAERVQTLASSCIPEPEHAVIAATCYQLAAV